MVSSPSPPAMTSLPAVPFRVLSAAVPGMVTVRPWQIAGAYAVAAGTIAIITKSATGKMSRRMASPFWVS